MCKSRRQLLRAANGKPLARLDEHSPFHVQKKQVLAAIRDHSCQMLIKGTRRRCCLPCTSQRRRLLGLLRQSKRKTVISPSRFTTHAHLTTPQKNKKLQTLIAWQKVFRRKISRMKKKIIKSTKERGINVCPSLDGDLRAIMAEKTPDVYKQYSFGTFRRLFWDEQRKASTVKSASGMRWHPVMIRWALNLKMLSSSAYHALRTSGFVKLPSERTLRDYTHFFHQKTGFQKEVNDMLVAEAGIATSSEGGKLVTIVFDEMRIREDLVFNKNTQEIVGFVELDKVGKDSRAIKKSTKQEKLNDIATHVLVLMVRSFLTSLRFSFAYLRQTG